jgi:hypothetical protein
VEVSLAAVRVDWSEVVSGATGERLGEGAGTAFAGAVVFGGEAALTSRCPSGPGDAATFPRGPGWREAARAGTALAAAVVSGNDAAPTSELPLVPRDAATLSREPGGSGTMLRAGSVEVVSCFRGGGLGSGAETALAGAVVFGNEAALTSGFPSGPGDAATFSREPGWREAARPSAARFVDPRNLEPSLRTRVSETLTRSDRRG